MATAAAAIALAGLDTCRTGPVALRRLLAPARETAEVPQPDGRWARLPCDRVAVVSGLAAAAC